MSKKRIPQRVSATILKSLSAGVVPRIGLEHIAVGRKEEIESLLEDLGNIFQWDHPLRVYPSFLI